MRPSRGHNDPFADVPQLDVKTVQSLWENRETSILDVREPSEWDLGHIDGVDFIPLDELRMRMKELSQDKNWVVVCRKGIRSNFAALLMRQAGYEASNMSGGMLDWQSKKLPITDPGIVEAH